MDHIENILAAKAMIEAMPDSAFIEDLEWWANEAMVNDPQSCGAVGCFGGWIAADPYFQKIGVLRGPDGSPYMRGIFSSSATAFCLFGSEGAFQPRGGDEPGSEKQIILARLDKALQAAIVQDEEE